MDEILDFDEIFFGNLDEYKKLVIGLLESLKEVTPSTFWSMESDEVKGLSTIMTIKIIELVLNSLDKVSDKLYCTNLVTHEFPFFVETKEMIELLLLDPFYESDDYINLAITLFSEFFTLLEVKLLLFGGCSMEIEAPVEVMLEYDMELDKYLDKFDKYKDDFIKLHVEDI